MLRVRIECNGQIEKIFDCLAKLTKNFEYKIWEYNNKVYLSLKTGNKAELEEILKKLKEVSDFRFLRVDYSLPWWIRWMKLTFHC